MPEIVSSASSNLQILEPKNQQGAAEKNIAKLLHQAGIATEVLKGDSFHLKVENEPFIPLSIERHGQELYLTHYLTDNFGNLFLDAEMVFNVSAQGQLTLTQTATQNSLGGEYRSYDRYFGQIFSRNLIQQGFGEAALLANLAKQQSVMVQEQPLVEVGNLYEPALGQGQAIVEVENLNQPVSGQEQSLAKVNSSEQIEAPPKLEPVSTATTTADKLEPATTVVPVVSPAGQKAVEPLLQLPQIVTTEPTRTKSPLKSFTSTQVLKAEPQGVQLSLFDIGLSPFTPAELGSVPQNIAKVEKEPTLTVSLVEESVQSINKTAVTGQAETPLVNKEDSTSLRNLPTSPVPSTNSATSATETVDPMQLFVQVVERVDRRTGEMLATLNSSSPSLNTLRDWYKAARELGKSQKHLDRISQTGNNFKQGEPLTDKAIEVMTKDFQAHYKQLMIVEQLGNLGDRDLLALHQNITHYLNSPPPSPPAQADKQKVESEVKQLTERINALGSQQADQLATVEAMQKSPFRSWNGKYEGAVAQVEQTANKLENAIAHLQQRQNQLGQWSKLERAYSLWNKSPQTMEMRSLAKGLQSPQLQERLSSIAKAGRQEFARSEASSARQAGLSA